LYYCPFDPPCKTGQNLTAGKRSEKKKRTKSSGLPKLLCWSQKLCSDKNLKIYISSTSKIGEREKITFSHFDFCPAADVLQFSHYHILFK
jgi:hypothetical protein